MCFFIFLSFFFQSDTVFSATTGEMKLNVSPSVFDMSLTKGDVWSSYITIINDNDRTVTFYVDKIDQEIRKDGSFAPLIDFGGRTANQPSSYKVSSWINFDKDKITLAKGEKGNIPFTIKVPDNAEPGEHRASILIGGAPLNKGGEEGLNTKSFISSVVAVKISGVFKESGYIREFSTARRFYTELPVELFLKFENTGSVRLSPKGSIKIYDIWGNDLLLQNNLSGAVLLGEVLPGQIQEQKFSLDKGEFFSAGVYFASADLTFGGLDAKRDSESVMFFMVPAGFFGKIVFFLLLVITIIMIPFLVYLIFGWFADRAGRMKKNSL